MSLGRLHDQAQRLIHLLILQHHLPLIVCDSRLIVQFVTDRSPVAVSSTYIAYVRLYVLYRQGYRREAKVGDLEITCTRHVIEGGELRTKNSYRR